eukprot:jgi/Hompol1/1682/HPOL_004708-RA
MDPDKEKELLWIARDSLKAPLPSDWKPCQTEDGNIYYFNFKTGESIWDHPCDEHYKAIYQKEKAKLESARKAAGAPNTLANNPIAKSTLEPTKETQAQPSSALNTKPVGKPLGNGISTDSIQDMILSDDEVVRLICTA